jgi:hypothetical protein
MIQRVLVVTRKVVATGLAVAAAQGPVIIGSESALAFQPVDVVMPHDDHPERDAQGRAGLDQRVERFVTTSSGSADSYFFRPA